MTIQEDKSRWESDTYRPNIDRFSERKKEFKTSSEIQLEPIYTPPSGQEHFQEQIGFPGEYPFTRGIHPAMYRSRLWTMRQYAGYATAEQSNQRYRYLLEQGQTGLSVAFDLPTQIGYDADDPIVIGEVGKVGVSISSIEDMETLFKDIPLDKVSTSMTINAPASVLLAMYIAVAKRQGVSPNKLRGTIQNDILKEYVARGTYIFPPKPSMRLITDIFQYCRAEVPRWNTISISGYHIREAGSTAVQEVAFTLANGIAYTDTRRRRQRRWTRRSRPGCSAGSRMSKRLSRLVWMSMNLPPRSLSSSMLITTSWKKLLNIGLPAACGQRS